VRRRLWWALLCAAPLAGCGILLPGEKGERTKYAYTLTVENTASWVVTAVVSYTERSVADECSKSGDTVRVEVSPAETERAEISTLCYVEPSVSTSVTLPAEAPLERKVYGFAAGASVLCSASGCVLKQ